MEPWGWTAVGVLLTFTIFLANVIFKTGHLAARVEELERWRTDVRKDLHEVSDKLEVMNSSLMSLSVLIRERTNRKRFPKINKDDNDDDDDDGDDEDNKCPLKKECPFNRSQ